MIHLYDSFIFEIMKTLKFHWISVSLLVPIKYQAYVLSVNFNFNFNFFNFIL